MRERRHVLVVDDDPGVREIFGEMLEEAGHQVSTADGGTSMRAILDRDDTVQVVVLDHEMRGERGSALALYAQACGLPVVMVSGNPPAMQFAEENHLQLLWKPFDYEDLLDAIDDAMASGEAGQRRA